MLTSGFRLIASKQAQYSTVLTAVRDDFEDERTAADYSVSVISFRIASMSSCEKLDTMKAISSVG